MTPAETIEKDTSTPAEPTVKAPANPIKVDNAKALSDDDKAKVKKAVEDANKDGSGNSTLPVGATIEVGDDGTVTVKDKDGNVIGTLTPAQTVKQDDTKLGVKAPEKVKVADPNHLTDAEKQAVKNAIIAANPDLADATIEVDDKGNVTVTKDGKTGTLSPAQTVRLASAPELEAKSNGSVTVTPPQDAKEVVIDYTDANGTPRKLILRRDGNGNWMLPTGADPSITMDGNGKVTIPAKSMKPGSFVAATAKYANGVQSKDGVIGVDTRSNKGGQLILPGAPATEDTTKKPVEKYETGTHKLYILGYEDNTFRPEGNMTRAEAATIIARLQGLSLANSARPNFIDVRTGWYNGAINAVVNAGYMKGYPDGSFRPNGKITRAEFAQMIKTIDKANTGMAPFADVKGHWAEAAINQAYSNARITGYPDGTFRPNNHITRAEAVTVFNKLYNRSVDNKGLSQVANKVAPFKDVTPNHWAYYQIIEASNTHVFYRTEKGQVAETWDTMAQTWKQALENR